MGSSIESVEILAPHRCVGAWLKEAPGADVAHLIARYDRCELVASCGRHFPIYDAERSRLGVRLCPECVRRSK